MAATAAAEGISLSSLRMSESRDPNLSGTRSLFLFFKIPELNRLKRYCFRLKSRGFLKLYTATNVANQVLHSDTGKFKINER